MEQPVAECFRFGTGEFAVEADELGPCEQVRRDDCREEPGLIADEVMLTGKRAADMADYMAELQDFLETAKSANCPVLLLVIPHCAQVNAVYARFL